MSPAVAAAAAARARGRIKQRLEDFVVEEIAAYAPSGVGDHLFVRFTKSDLTTIDAVRLIAGALGCDARAAGIAGLKDRRAVTTQTISLQVPRGAHAVALAARARELAIDRIRVHEATPHGHKIRAGHLAGNRFEIAVRDVALDRVGEVTGAFESVAKTGVPNAFGAQRFGAGGRNPARAVAWLHGERGPRDPRLLRLLWSSLQSSVFNAVLEARVADGTWATPLEGDLLKVRGSGGLFVCSDVQNDRARADAGGAVSPTGPMIGARMRWPEGRPRDLEREIADRMLGQGADLSRARRLGEGSRRALRVWVDDLRWAIDPGGPEDAGKRVACMRVTFVLPKGAYATTVLGAALTIDESRGESGARDDEEITGEFTD